MLDLQDKSSNQNPNKKQIAIVLLLFFIVIILIVLVWSFFIFGLDKISTVFKYIDNLYASGKLPLPIILSIVTALATIITATITTIITKNNELRLQIRSEQREKKAIIYEELTEFFFKIIFSSKLENQVGNIIPENQEKEIVHFLTQYTPKIIMWGSDEVLREFYLFRSYSLETTSDPTKVFEVIRKFEELLFSIRRDLGHKNNKLQKGNILGLFVDDVDNLFKK